jgi:hypothetical protein
MQTMMIQMKVEQMLEAVAPPTAAKALLFQIPRPWPGVLRSKQDLTDIQRLLLAETATARKVEVAKVMQLSHSSRMESRDSPSQASHLPMDQSLETPE